ncbi:hypothetical protein KI387_009753, partial [Taxus chinensis]
MAIAAVAHIFVFPVEPYRLISENKQGRLTVQSTAVTVETRKDSQKTRDEQGTDVAQVLETDVEGRGTSLKESVQDIVIAGGEH